MHNKEHEGRLVACADHVNGQWAAYPIMNSHSHVIVSDNHGGTWRVGSEELLLNTSNECSIAELANGTVVMNARNYVGQSEKTVHRYIAHSYDAGETWPVGWFASDLPDPVVFSALAADAAGKTLYLTHPASSSARRNVSLFTSTDGGWSWAERLTLDAGPSQYSSIVVLPNASLAIQWDSGCGGSAKPSSSACDKARPTQDKFAIVTVSEMDE